MKKFFSGFLFGALTSGAITLLINPRDGKCNRKVLLDKINQLHSTINDLNESTHTLHSSIDRLKTEGLKSLSLFTEDFSQSLINFQLENKGRINRLKTAVTNLQDRLDQLP